MALRRISNTPSADTFRLVSQPCGMVEAATNKINTLLESFLGINDSELGKRMSDSGTSETSTSEYRHPLPHERTYNNGDICAFLRDSGYRRRISMFRLCPLFQYRTAPVGSIR